jgi:hypothetical protein
MAQVVEHLPSKCEALNSKVQTPVWQKNKQTNKKTMNLKDKPEEFSVNCCIPRRDSDEYRIQRKDDKCRSILFKVLA